MGRPRKPTAELEAKGSFLRHPERKREREHEPPTVGELGEPPKHLTAAAKAAWRELAAIIPRGVAGSADRWAVELLVCLMSKFRKGEAKASEAGQIESLLGRLGLTPADRSKVSVRLADAMQRQPIEPVIPAKPQPSSAWSQLLSRKPQ